MSKPRWYYTNFDLLFSHNRNYDEEIKYVASVCNICNRYVQEIGAGTGKHGERILEYRPSMVELVDNDARAVELLKVRFEKHTNVHVSYCDGFDDSGYREFDIIICMHSLIQVSAINLREVVSRISALYNRLLPGGKLFVEAIDYDVSRRVYEHGEVTWIYRGDRGKVGISSHYYDDALEIRFQGNVDSSSIDYSVRLAAANLSDFGNIAQDAVASEFGYCRLEESGRRLLMYFGKQ